MPSVGAIAPTTLAPATGHTHEMQNCGMLYFDPLMSKQFVNEPFGSLISDAARIACAMPCKQMHASERAKGRHGLI